MNISLKIATASFFAMAIIGCGSSDSDSKNVSTSDLEGEWVGICKLDQNSGTSEQDFQEYTDKTVKIRTVVYDNLTCNPENNAILHDMTLNMGYTLGDNIKTVTGKEAIKIDFNYTGFNLAKGTVQSLPKAGTKSYTIIYLENKKLYAGDDSDINATTSADTRPTKIDFTDPVTKK